MAKLLLVQVCTLKQYQSDPPTYPGSTILLLYEFDLLRFHIQVITYNICLPLFWVISGSIREPKVHSRCHNWECSSSHGWIMSHCVYILHPFNPFTCLWAFRIFPCLGYSEQNCNETWECWYLLELLFLASSKIKNTSIIWSSNSTHPKEVLRFKVRSTLHCDPLQLRKQWMWRTLHKCTQQMLSKWWWQLHQKRLKTHLGVNPGF